MLDNKKHSHAEYDVDLYSDDAILNPYDHYREIRERGPAVWLPRHNLWAIGRHADVRAALAANDVLISGRGVAANGKVNEIANNNILATDEPTHGELRKVIAAPVMPRGLAAVKERIVTTAQEMVAGLVERDGFDGMRDLAQILPLTVVSELLGLPESGRQNMLRWAAASFDALGGANERRDAAFPTILELREFCNNGATRAAVKPGSWVAGLYDAADAGLIDPDLVPQFTRDYIAPSLDTTIFATGHLMYHLGQNPDQWDALRAKPRLIANAINEAVRIEAPIRGFTRYVVEDYDVDGTVIPKGDRVIVLFASANRDERRWDTPEKFDVHRVVTDHVGFGHGVHQCMGMQLARLEMRSILEAMIDHVARIETGEPVFEINSVLRGYRELPMRFISA
ncbi:cytochrome P450 [Aquicoccus porphyridii]|uniref:cytochrome P450 n=1 Tax=Aquicoccus porphyridii TaxID=1852029 RepID=UPI00273FA5EE|nr:cytochrome P450 [Aquicoccus porphyridii]